MDLFTILKTIHVLAAAAWAGAAFYELVISHRLRKANDAAALVRFLEDAELLGQRYFAPAAGTAALTGILMVIVGWPNFTDLWIIIGIALFLTTSVLGAGFLTPASGRAKEALLQKGPDDPDTRAQLDRLQLGTRADSLLLVLIIADMVIKPRL